MQPFLKIKKDTTLSFVPEEELHITIWIRLKFQNLTIRRILILSSMTYNESWREAYWKVKHNLWGTVWSIAAHICNRLWHGILSGQQNTILVFTWQYLWNTPRVETVHGFEFQNRRIYESFLWYKHKILCLDISAANWSKFLTLLHFNTDFTLDCNKVLLFNFSELN